MLSGQEIFDREGENPNIYSNLKERQCTTNPWLSSYMSEIGLTDPRMDDGAKRRFFWLTCLSVSIMGGDDISNVDYVKVSKETIAEAKALQLSFTLESIRGKSKHFDEITDEAQYCVEELNKFYNTEMQTKVDTDLIWGNMGVIFYAYFLELQKIDRL